MNNVLFTFIEHELEENAVCDRAACQKAASSAFEAKILCHCGGGIGGARAKMAD